ncbi:MAG: glycosyltransferase family 4 protein [Clostridia bacterium]|nr:glycosyltransferase family 4 protein [Clostridia bacterium]
MKVAILAPIPPPAGGIGAWMVRMLEAKLKNGWEIVHIDESVLGKRNTFASKRKFLEEFKRNRKIWKDLKNALKDPEVKVVHSCIPSSTFGMMREYICARITKKRKRKFIIHYRCTTTNMTQGKMGYFMFKKLTNISDCAMVLNNESKEMVEKYSKTKAIIIPNFVESNTVNRKGEKEISDTVKTALYVGGVVTRKGCYHILDMARHFSDIEFRLVGTVGVPFENVPDNFKLLGEKKKPEVAEEMKNADIFLFPSYFQGEGFSNALAEAMAKGLPCITTKWAANHDMIEDKGGIAVEIKNSQALIDALEKIKDDKELRQSMSDFNIDKVNTYYTDKAVLDQYVDVYESLL